MQLDQHYVEPRLVAMYDIENCGRFDIDFYIALAAEIDPTRIIDFGCGTGMLTRELVTAEREIIGIDPAGAMLAYARQQPDSDKVEWIHGDSSNLEERAADLVIMTGNVAQVFLDDDEWEETLRRIRQTLKQGGHIAFESRNPEAKAWENWNPDTTFAMIESPSGQVETWLEVIEVGEKQVKFRGHNRFIDTNEVILVDSTLRFRTYTEIVKSLEENGFAINHVYGDWQCKPFEPADRMMIFVASAVG